MPRKEKKRDLGPIVLIKKTARVIKNHEKSPYGEICNMEEQDAQ